MIFNSEKINEVILKQRKILKFERKSETLDHLFEQELRLLNEDKQTIEDYDERSDRLRDMKIKLHNNLVQGIREELKDTKEITDFESFYSRYWFHDLLFNKKSFDFWKKKNNSQK